MTQKRNYKRRNYFVKKGYQSGFILKFLIIILAGTIFSSGLLFFFTQDTLTSSYENSRLFVRSTSHAIFPAVFYTNAITLILIILAAIGVILFISHRIAGPMFRFEMELKEIGKGNLTRKIGLRETDQIKEMALSLNNMTSNIRGRIIAIRLEIGMVIETAKREGVSEELLLELNNLQQKLDKKFKVS